MIQSVLVYLENTVKQFPDKIAIDDGKLRVSFHEWKHMALCIASELKKKGVGRKVPVLVYLPKGTMTLISFAGVLYSGNYYTPTDVKFPFHKVKGILDCLHPKAILSDKKSAEKLIDNGIEREKIIYIEDIDFNMGEVDSQQYLDRIIDTDLAYVFFTSGSTGVPKGVAITQRSIIDYIDWAGEEFDITEREIIANQAPFYFDNSILDIYLCMSRGATLHIVPEMYYSFPAKLLQYLIDNQVNFIFWVPSAIIGVANSGLLEKLDCSCIKKVLFCGEVMPNRQLNIWRKNLPHAVYANLYGPTEITDVCAYYRVDREFKDDEPLPIGKACRNTEMLILDENNQMIETPDAMGELCVRGTCLAVGYYGNEQKTREAFVQNPLNSLYDEKIYRTGDLGHYNEHGEIMFDGRKDFQIKHMGFRIELGEIEVAAVSIEQIQTACCLYDVDKQSIILCYQAGAELDSVLLKKELMNILPKYMIPAEYYYIENMPHNDNGKIDRKLLKEKYI